MRWTVLQKRINQVRARLTGGDQTPYLALDLPTPDMPILYPARVELSGWAFSPREQTKKVEVFQGKRPLGRLQHGLQRADVAAHFENQAALNSGFHGAVILGDTDTPLTLKATFVSGESHQLPCRLNLVRSPLDFELHHPAEQTELYPGTLTIRGQIKNTNHHLMALRIFIDGILHQIIPTGKVQFEQSLSLAELNTGTYQLTIEAQTTNNVRFAHTRQIIIKPTPIKLMVEDPATTDILTDATTLYIKGWAYSHAAPIKQITACILNQAAPEAHLKNGNLRPDVSQKYGHPRALTSGFEGNLTLPATSARQTLIVKALDEAGFQLERHIPLTENDDLEQQNEQWLPTVTDLPEVKLSVDTPTSDTQITQGGVIEFNGWAFSQAAAIRTVEVYTEDTLLGELTCGVYRSDVADYFENNHMTYSGFHGNIRLEDLPPGDLPLTLKAIDEQSNTATQTITLHLQERSQSEFILEQATWVDSQLTVSGYAYWPGSKSPRTVTFHVANQLIGSARLNLSRPDVATRFPDNAEDACRGFYFTDSFSPSGQNSVDLQIQITEATGKHHTRTQTITHSGELIPSSQSQHLEQIRGWLMRCASTTDAQLSVLDWGTNLDLANHNAQYTVFAVQASGALPYFDDSIDVVIYAGASKQEEAQRVARVAVIDLQREKAQINWKQEAPLTHWQASIIIPVYGQLDYTRACLEQVRRTIPASITYEVIVIDDHSPDDSLAYLEALAQEWPQLQVIHNAQNEGFIFSCNRGAAAAHYEYLVFLNNDTLPHMHWLAPLLRTLQQQPDVGAVGGKLLYPDGSLQEAGGVVFSDGSAWNFGRGDVQIKHPLYQHVRTVDYCSGALLATPKTLFEQLGGFETKYSPAYYEDTDYCFKVQQAGKRVLYQPESVITHFEGTTAGQDTTQGVKQYQVINAETFKTTWTDLLSAQHPPLPGTNRRALHHVVTPPGTRHVLICSPVMPEFDRESGSRRIFHIIMLLQAAGWSVTFLADKMTAGDRYTRVLQQMGVMVYAGEKSRHAGDEYLPDLRQLITMTHFDLAIIAFWHYAEALRPIFRESSPHTRVIVDSIDLHFMRFAREVFYQTTATERTLKRHYGDIVRRELNSYAAADAVLTVSDKEADLINDLMADDQHAFAVPDMEAIPVSTVPFTARRGILFVGNFRHDPNRDAVQHLLQDILPHIPPKLLEAHPLYIVGNALDESVASLADDHPNIHMIGWVPTLRPYLEKVRISVAPLRYGAGTKRKVIDALMMGTPTVATSIGAEGFDLQHETHVLIADAPAAFAQAMIRLLEDQSLWEQLTIQGRAAIATKHGKQAVYERLMQAIQTVLERPSTHD